MRGGPRETQHIPKEQSQQLASLEGYTSMKELDEAINPEQQSVPPMPPPVVPSIPPQPFEGGSLMDRLGWNQPGPSAASEGARPKSFFGSVGKES